MSRQPRQALPQPAEKEPPLNLWTLLKDWVGKDVQSLSLPLSLHEPTTELMKAAEDMEHSALLDEAAALPPRSVERLLRVAAFALAPYATGGAAQRARKPLDPMLGETYMLEVNGVRFIGEQVHERPYTGAIRAEGRAWVIDAEVQPKGTFWGPTIDINLNWLLQLTFADGDAYEWRKVTTTINGILKGPSKIYLSHRGELVVRNQAAGMSAHVTFLARKRAGRGQKDSPHALEGHVVVDGERLDFPRLYGAWNDRLVAEAAAGVEQLLWQKQPAPSDPSWWHAPTPFFFCLNEMTPELRASLPPTDSRWRADMRALEEGRYSEAQHEHRKLRAHNAAQVARILRARRQPLHLAYSPAWFELLDAKDAPGLTPGGVRLRYRFKQGEGSFWAVHARGAWSAEQEHGCLVVDRAGDV